MPARTGAVDQEILGRASCCPDLPNLVDCTEEALRDLSAREGIDFATALLYDRLRRSTDHQPFIDRLETLMTSTDPMPRLDARVVIVPGAFYKMYPRSGADGRVMREAAARFGIDTEIVPLPDFSSLGENARLICTWLSAHADDGRPIVLISLSKGGGDIKCALARDDAAQAFRHVAMWINLSGILDGTPLVTWLLADTWRSRWTRWYLKRRGYSDLSILRGLHRGNGSLLSGALNLPAHMRAIHVVGFPLSMHATNALARRNRVRLTPYGPNDGAGIILADACRWPGRLYPLWSADHYLRAKDRALPRVSAALLRYASLSLQTETVA